MSVGTATVQFETTTLTANRTFAIRAVDGENGQNAAEVQVRVRKGRSPLRPPTVPRRLGDEIVLIGITTTAP
jgi:hypothetical protein